MRAFVPVALGLTTTALGTVLPVLREKGLLRGRLGRYLLAAGAVGELFPVVAIALFLGTRSRFPALASLGGVVVLVVLLGLARRAVREGGRLATVVRLGQHQTAQITLRATIVLLLALIAVTDRFHLDAVLGAFLAGIVLRRWAGPDAPVLESKLDAVGYSFFVPLFFVYSGMGLDLRSIAEAPLRLVLFFVLILAVRGLPALLVYRGALPGRGNGCRPTWSRRPRCRSWWRWPRSGCATARCCRENAAALVGAGVLTVLLLPALAVSLGRGPEAASDAPPSVSGAERHADEPTSSSVKLGIHPSSRPLLAPQKRRHRPLTGFLVKGMVASCTSSR